MVNAVSWFEIPVADMDRAVVFYSAILDDILPVEEVLGRTIAFLPCSEGGVGGSLTEGYGFAPSQEGSLVYLSGGDDLNEVLGRVEGAGGKILMPKTGIGPYGYIALFLDSEGNRVGLHSRG